MRHQNEIIAPKQTFISGIQKLQSDICLVGSAPLTQRVIEQHVTNISAFFINAIEVLEFNRENLLSWVTTPLIGMYTSFAIIIDYILVHRD